MTEQDGGGSLIALLGPTASGKSRLALQMAQHFSIEIVSVDSAQVYRGLDLGTAKPSALERAQVPHHLIDLLDPTRAYSAALFIVDAEAAIAAVRRRGALPLLVGGTMLYAKALREGLASLPAADPAVRQRLERDAAQLGWAAMHARLARVDPPTAARLQPGDSQRIQRALEVYELTATPMSRLLSKPATATARPHVHTIALLPSDRARLHQAIEQRFDTMLAAGFLDEVRALRARGDLHAQLPAMRSVGYRQAWAHLEQGTDFKTFRAASIAASRQLAKRQITWLRATPQVHLIDPFQADAAARLRRLIEALRDQA